MPRRRLRLSSLAFSRWKRSSALRTFRSRSLRAACCAACSCSASFCSGFFLRASLHGRRSGFFRPECLSQSSLRWLSLQNLRRGSASLGSFLWQ